MACCDWDTFELGFTSVWQKWGYGMALIDWKVAKRDWKRYHCTGFEAATMQKQVLAREAEYLYMCKDKPEDDGDDDWRGGTGAGVKPKPPHLVH